MLRISAAQSWAMLNTTEESKIRRLACLVTRVILRRDFFCTQLLISLSDVQRSIRRLYKGRKQIVGEMDGNGLLTRRM